MKNMRFLLIFLAVSTSALADNEQPFECNYNGNQQEIIACAVRDYKAADAKLNETWKIVMSSLSLGRRTELRRQQREWLKKRDPTCKAKADVYKGGSIWPLEYYGCLQSATEKRTKEIQSRQHTK